MSTFSPFGCMSVERSKDVCREFVWDEWNHDWPPATWVNNFSNQAPPLKLNILHCWKYYNYVKCLLTHVRCHCHGIAEASSFGSCCQLGVVLYWLDRLWPLGKEPRKEMKQQQGPRRQAGRFMHHLYLRTIDDRGWCRTWSAVVTLTKNKSCECRVHVAKLVVYMALSLLAAHLVMIYIPLVLHWINAYMEDLICLAIWHAYM